VREGFIKKSPPTPLYERGGLKKIGEGEGGVIKRLRA